MGLSYSQDNQTKDSETVKQPDRENPEANHQLRGQARGHYDGCNSLKRKLI